MRIYEKRKFNIIVFYFRFSPSPPNDSGNGSIAGLNSPPKVSDSENEANIEGHYQKQTSTPASDDKVCFFGSIHMMLK